jgi:hypothetical protein
MAVRMTEKFDMPANIDAFKLKTWEERGGEYVRRLARYFDLTLEQAAGMAGNLGYESIGFKTLQEISPAAPGSRGGAGVAMWTGPRRVKFEYYCTTNKLDPKSDEGNWAFLTWELRNTHKKTITALRKCKTLEDAVFSVGQTFERPLGTTATHLPGYDERVEWAQRALAGAVSGAEPSGVDDYLIVLQRLLKATGDYSGEIDGIDGPLTKAAVAAIQRRIQA